MVSPATMRTAYDGLCYGSAFSLPRVSSVSTYSNDETVIFAKAYNAAVHLCRHSTMGAASKDSAHATLHCTKATLAWTGALPYGTRLCL